jgi:hypothetical protein
METERFGSTEKEQDWIQKYRAALDVTSRTESRMKAVHSTFSKVAGIISFGMRSILKKRARTPPNAAVSKQPAKPGRVPTPTMPDQRVHSVQSSVVKESAARKHPSLQRRSQGKAS